MHSCRSADLASTCGVIIPGFSQGRFAFDLWRENRCLSPNDNVATRRSVGPEAVARGGDEF